MDNKIIGILERAIIGEDISLKEGIELYKNTEAIALMDGAHRVRKRLHPGNEVTWIIDRNINISNICSAGCMFCNFSCTSNSSEAYITGYDTYKKKIEELQLLGGNQLLLQGGLHPELGLSFYIELFRKLKLSYPALKLHALGPPEVIHIANIEGMFIGDVLDQLIEAGLDSLPGAGAEILSDRVRERLSPGKCTTMEWLEVMHEAHKRGLTTSATMMFGHIETLEERINHLFLIRDLQKQKPKSAKGFISFIPWTFQDQGTALARKTDLRKKVTIFEYVKFFSLSRLILTNILNMQPSWLTVGIPAAIICLHSGGNDMGSIMIEEQVVSRAGAKYRIDSQGMTEAIKQAGFIPVLRDQEFNKIEYQ